MGQNRLLVWSGVVRADGKLCEVFWIFLHDVQDSTEVDAWVAPVDWDAEYSAFLCRAGKLLGEEVPRTWCAPRVHASLVGDLGDSRCAGVWATPAEVVWGKVVGDWAGLEVRLGIGVHCGCVVS